MTDGLFFSERTHGVPEPTLDELPERTKTGLLGLVEDKLESNWFAHVFPQKCPDGDGIVGTNTRASVEAYSD